MFDNKDENDYFDYPSYSNNSLPPPSIERPLSQLEGHQLFPDLIDAETTENQKEVDKPKPKKPQVTELKYDGDLSVY